MPKPSTQENIVASVRPPKRETCKTRVKTNNQKPAEVPKVKEPHRNTRCGQTKPR